MPVRRVGLGSAVALLGCLLAVGIGGLAHPFEAAGEHCSSIVLDNRGQAIFGCNYDQSRNDPGLVFVNKRGLDKTGLGPGTTGAVARWTVRYASVVFSLAGYQQTWAGMNERGLTLSTMSLPETVNEPLDERPPLEWLWPQYLLDTCETVEEVIATDALVHTYTRDHYLVADRYGGVAVIEFLHGRMEAHSGAQLCAPVLTNSIYSASCEIWERLQSTRAYYRYGNSIERFCLGADRVTSFEGTTTEAAVDYAFTTLRAIYRPEIQHYTRWSIVFDTTNLRAYFKTQSNPEIRWVDLEAFDLGCHRPPLMLDMNEGLTGDVSDRFTDYDSDRNLAFMEDYYNRWGIPYEPEEVEAMFQHLEGFPCEQHWRMGSRRLTPGGRSPRTPAP